MLRSRQRQGSRGWSEMLGWREGSVGRGRDVCLALRLQDRLWMDEREEMDQVWHGRPGSGAPGAPCQGISSGPLIVPARTQAPRDYGERKEPLRAPLGPLWSVAPALRGTCDVLHVPWVVRPSLVTSCQRRSERVVQVGYWPRGMPVSQAPGLPIGDPG